MASVAELLLGHEKLGGADEQRPGQDRHNPELGHSLSLQVAMELGRVELGPLRYLPRGKLLFAHQPDEVLLEKSKAKVFNHGGPASVGLRIYMY